MTEPGHKLSKEQIIAGIVMLLVVGVGLGALIFGGSDSSSPQGGLANVKAEDTVPSIGDQCSALTGIAVTATKIYNGQLSVLDFDGTHGDGAEVDELPQNLGYPTGTAGLQRWLVDVSRIMTDQGHDQDLWSPNQNVTIKNHRVDPGQTFTILAPDGVVALDYNGNANDDIRMSDRQAISLILAGIIEDHPQDPAELFAALPVTC